MKEHLTDEELALYSEFLQNKNRIKIPSNIIEHINFCDKCASEAVNLSFISDDITNELKYDLEKERKTVFFSKKLILSVAATILIFFSVWQIFGFFKEKNKIYPAQRISAIYKNIRNNKIIAKPTETEVETKNENNKLLACYEPNEEAELLIDNFNANSRGDNIEIISPSLINSKNDKKTTLEWKNPENIELTIEIYNNKMTKIENAEIIGNSYKVKNLPKGLYYWKLFNSDFDLIFFGKILF